MRTLTRIKIRLEHGLFLAVARSLTYNINYAVVRTTERGTDTLLFFLQDTYHDELP